MSIQAVIDLAESQLGITEYPAGSNHVLYNTEYYGKDVMGDMYPWCVVFLWWVFNHAGEAKAFFNSGKTASCSVLQSLYKAEGRYFTDGNYIPGDIALLSFRADKAIQHCGLITKKFDDYNYITIEGNTSPGMEGSQHNGGCVAKKKRHNYNIVGVCRPIYSEEPKKADYIDHWAQANIEWALENKIASGYPDGNFKPNANMTRAEAATLAKNTVDYILGVLKK